MVLQYFVWYPLTLLLLLHSWIGKAVADCSVDVLLQLQSYVSQLLSEGLLTDKSPWELHVLQSADAATAVLRVHQSVADGPALVTLLCRCLSDTKVSSCSTVSHSTLLYVYLILLGSV